MKIQKEQFRKEFHSSIGVLNSVARLLAGGWGIPIFNFFDRLQRGKKLNDPSYKNETHYVKSTQGGPDIRVRVFRPKHVEGPLPAMLYCHGGGYMVGSPENYLMVYNYFLKKRPCIIVAPDYRNSPKAPFPAGFNDCYDTLLWMKAHAEELGAVSDQFMVGGHSAGGGLTAAVTLKARDTQEVKIAFQMPIYPMIDDQQDSESAQYTDAPLWDAKTNEKGWRLYLKDLHTSNAEIPAYAAPARNTDYTNFPPTITFVGTLEPFRDETISYVESLKQQGIPVAFELFEGCYHGFDIAASKSEAGKAAWKFVLDAYAKYYDMSYPQI